MLKVTLIFTVLLIIGCESQRSHYELGLNPKDYLFDSVEIEGFATSDGTTGLRYCKNDCQLDSYSIKKNTGVFFSSFVTHRNEDYFSAPLNYNPFRWINESPSKFEYFPFGAGRHSCIARNLSDMQLKFISVLILQKYVPTLISQKIDLSLNISLIPKQGLNIILKPSKSYKTHTPVPINGNINSVAKFD